MLTTKESLMFLLGGAIGSVVTYFITKNYFEDMYTEEYEYEDVINIEDIEETSNISSPSLADIAAVTKSNDTVVEVNPTDMPKEDRKAAIEAYHEHEVRLDYAAISRETSEGDTDGDDSVEDKSKTSIDTINYFEMIDKNHFMNEDGRIKKTFTYYVNEGIGINDEEQLIENLDAMYFSGDLTNWFYTLELKVKDDPMNLDPDVLYLRDHEHDVDYEVIRVYEAYEQDIEEGINEE